MRGYGQQGQAVLHNIQYEAGDDRAYNAAFSSLHAGPAKNRSGDGVHLIPLSCQRLRRIQPRCHDHARNPGTQAAEGKYHDLVLPYIHAGTVQRNLIGTDKQAVVAESGLM